MLFYVAIFCTSLTLALILTPIVKNLALRIRAVDVPNHRKVHDTQIPRLGGVAVYLSFMAVFYGVQLLAPEAVRGVPGKEMFLRGFAIGSFIILCVGVADDIHGLPPGVKFVLHIVGAMVVYFHGLQIKILDIPFIGTLELRWLSLPFTVLWVAGVTNALNLIDGLDGLASGVTFIAVMTLFLIALSQGNTEVAIFSAVMGGCLVGFLRYNFNPAQIFLGDGGAYFLGFTLANFSIMGAMKSSTAVALMIPIIALGFPILDTFLAMLRRAGKAIRVGEGRKAIQHIGDADREHVHHKLIDMGYTHRGAVVLLYVLCLIFGAFAFTLTAYRNEVAGAILFFVALIVFVFVRTLGYLEFRGLKDGNFLEQYLGKIRGKISHGQGEEKPEEKDKDK